MLDLEVRDEALDALALEAQVAAGRTAAADHGQPHLLRVGAGLGLGHVHERTNDDVLLVVGHEPRRHRLERPLKEQVQQHGLDEIVQMVAERDLGRADLVGQPVEDAAAQPRAERTRRLAVLEDVVDHGADVGVLDVDVPAPRRARLGDEVVPEPLVAGVDVDRDDREVDRRPLAEDVEHLHQRPAVLAARQPHHDAIAVFDETVFDDRARGLLRDAGLERAAITHAFRISGDGDEAPRGVGPASDAPRHDGPRRPGARPVPRRPTARPWPRRATPDRVP